MIGVCCFRDNFRVDLDLGIILGGQPCIIDGQQDVLRDGLIRSNGASFPLVREDTGDILFATFGDFNRNHNALSTGWFLARVHNIHGE